MLSCLITAEDCPHLSAFLAEQDASHQQQWVHVQGQTNLLTQVSMHSVGCMFRGLTDMVLCSKHADLGIASQADQLL